MKLTTVTHVSVDGVMQGLGGPGEDRRRGFERGGWALPLFENDTEAATFVNQVYQRSDAFLFGRRTYEIFAGSTYPVVIGQGTRLFPETGPDTALDLADSRATPSGVTIGVYRPAGRPRYATATVG